MMVFSILLGVMLFVVGCSEKKIENLPTNIPATPVTLLKEESCGCCGKYAQYLEEQGFGVAVSERTDMVPVKEQYNIPMEMRSCHTTLIENYVVEGHVPVEAIAKLLTEKPNIRGIALPGMPSGSPGMSGEKDEVFLIYALNNDGGTSDFMRI